MIKAALVSSGLPILTYTQSADESNVNIRTKVGSPGYAALVIVTINAGVTVSGSAAIALYSGTGWTAGSKLKIINNGTAVGEGGAGGNGGTPGVSGNVGSNGLDAIETTIPIEIDNTNGFIFGGGGGGAGGRGNGGAGLSGAGGGGGGGGRGSNNPPGGTGGAAAVPGQAGTAGSLLSYGFGGLGGDNTEFYGTQGKYGGNGGDYGEDGSFSEDVQFGGVAGRAVRLNGQTITWLGGNNPTQVRGQIA